MTYLEEEHGVTVDPVSHLDIFAFASAGDAFGQIQDLLDRVAEFSERSALTKAEWYKQDLSAIYVTFDGAGTWADREGGSVDLIASADDEWSEDRIGEPVLGAGFSVAADAFEELRSRANWRDRLRQDGFCFARDDDYVYCYRLVYLAELVAKGPTVDAQARWVAPWFNESVRLIAVNDPGPLSSSAPTARSSSPEAVDSPGAATRRGRRTATSVGRLGRSFVVEPVILRRRRTLTAAQPPGLGRAERVAGAPSRTSPELPTGAGDADHQRLQFDPKRSRPPGPTRRSAIPPRWRP